MFRDRLKKFYRKRILDDRFGFVETGTFTNRAGDSKPITVSVTVSATVTEADATRDEMGRIEIFMLRDEADDLGGVATLQTGDSYIRDTDFDTDSEPYIFNDEITEKGEHYQKAVFERYESSARGRG